MTTLIIIPSHCIITWKFSSNNTLTSLISIPFIINCCFFADKNMSSIISWNYFSFILCFNIDNDSYYFYIMISRLLEKFPTNNNKYILLRASYLIAYSLLHDLLLQIRYKCVIQRKYYYNSIHIHRRNRFLFSFYLKKIRAHSKVNSFREKMTQLCSAWNYSAYPTYTKALGLWTITEILQQTRVQ